MTSSPNPSRTGRFSVGSDALALTCAPASVMVRTRRLGVEDIRTTLIGWLTGAPGEVDGASASGPGSSRDGDRPGRTVEPGPLPGREPEPVGAS